MSKTIQHTAFVNLYNKDSNIFQTLFKDTRTLSQLTSKIIKISKSYESLAYKDADKVKGDLFEIFAECFFKNLAADNRIGVYGYQPAPAVDDYGVDGFGIANNEMPCTIQVKFRSNATEELTLKDIKNFQGISYRHYKVPVESNSNLILFTNAKGLHWITEAKVLSGASITYGYNEISGLVDNLYSFWKNIEDMVQETIKEKYDIIR